MDRRVIRAKFGLKVFGPYFRFWVTTMFTTPTARGAIASVATLASLFFSTTALCAEHVVTQKGIAFVPASITVAPGDTVRWVFTLGFHTVTSGANCTADGTGINGILSAKSREFIWTVPASAAGTTIPYFCAPHCIFGMVASITVINPPVEHVVTQTLFAFDPPNITVAPGDTVRWIRTGGNHTVTSGSACFADGVYFDSPLNLANPQVVWTVPQTAAGTTIPYYCTVHCLFDMTGSIAVSGGPANPADINGDGAVNAQDLALLLNAWGTANAAADVNHDGIVNAIDLAAVLGSWTG